MPGLTAALVDGDYILAAERTGVPLRIEGVLADLRRRFGMASRMSVFISAPAGRLRPLQRETLSAHEVARVERAALSAVAEVIRVDRGVDVALAVHAIRQAQQVKTIVLVSGDSDFVPLLMAVRRTDVRTVLVSPDLRTSAALAVAADGRIDPGNLVEQAEGLIGPGSGESTTKQVIKLMGEASLRLVVIDPYVSEETVRLMAWSKPGAKLVLVSKKFSEATLQEAAHLVMAGRDLALYKSDAIHDRWFSVDGRWWHSGGSLKDLGRKWTRISEIDQPEEIDQTEQLLGSLTIPANAQALA